MIYVIIVRSEPVCTRFVGSDSIFSEPGKSEVKLLIFCIKT